MPPEAQILDNWNLGHGRGANTHTERYVYIYIFENIFSYILIFIYNHICVCNWVPNIHSSMQNPLIENSLYGWLLGIFGDALLIYASYFGEIGRTSYNCSSRCVWLPRDPHQFPAYAHLRPAWPVSILKVIVNNVTSTLLRI